MTPVIEVQDVTKVFSGYHRYQAGFKAFVLNPRSFLHGQHKDVFVALDHVSIAIYRGETFGIIGRNGAGKSTLLALIGGIYRPTDGNIFVRGQISPLLGLGAGFSYDLTGRENIALNGVLLGLRRRDIERKVDAVIEFSGLAESIDQPLKNYSSGMQMRLGFSIAVHVEPDILLVDEVLAVGDAEFHSKCIERIGKLRDQGVTIVFVSHDLEITERLCDRSAYLDKGRLVAIGAAHEVAETYRRDIAGVGSTAAVNAHIPVRSVGSK